MIGHLPRRIDISLCFFDYPLVTPLNKVRSQWAFKSHGVVHKGDLVHDLDAWAVLLDGLQPVSRHIKFLPRLFFTYCFKEVTYVNDSFYQLDLHSKLDYSRLHRSASLFELKRPRILVHTPIQQILAFGNNE